MANKVKTEQVWTKDIGFDELQNETYSNMISNQYGNVVAVCYGKTIEECEARAELIEAAPKMLKNHITDVILIEDFIKRYKEGNTNEVVYFLENLLVSTKSIIKKLIK